MTLNTRFGKHRSQSQRRYILIQHHVKTGRIVTIKRSDSADTLHTQARRWGYSWDRYAHQYITHPDRTFEAVVFDTVEGGEVPRYGPPF